MSDLVRELFVDNPMLEEASRARRRLVRGGTERPIVNYTVLGVAGFFYLWLLGTIIRYREDMASGLLITGLVIITLVVPAIVYGAVAGERERATWDALVLTRLTPAQIVVGKIGWRFGVVGILMALVAVPALLSHMTADRPDRFTTGNLLLSLILTAAWGLFLCAYGLWISSSSKRSVTALGVIAGILLAALALIPILLMILVSPTGQDLDTGGGGPLHWLYWSFMHINPFVALTNLLIDIYPATDTSTVAGAWRGIMWGLLPLLFYLVGSALFISLTLRRLRRLEEPRRRGG